MCPSSCAANKKARYRGQHDFHRKHLGASSELSAVSFKATSRSDCLRTKAIIWGSNWPSSMSLPIENVLFLFYFFRKKEEEEEKKKLWWARISQLAIHCSEIRFTVG
jgi:hypothetical protein